MADLSFNQVLDLASRLPRAQRAELIARLVHDLAAEPADHTAATEASADAWEWLQQFRDELYALGPVTPPPAEQRERDRHERDAMLMGHASTALAPPPAPESWSWAQMAAFITDFHATYPDIDPTAQVIADRRAHDGVDSAHD